MLPPHDRAAGIISQHIVLTTSMMCPQRDARVWVGTGRSFPFLKLTNMPVTVLKNNVRKNGDGHIYSHQDGSSVKYPGLVIEVGYSDWRKKSHRDICLWIENSDHHVGELNYFVDYLGNHRIGLQSCN